MAKRINVSFSREEALKLGLLVCADCGYPPNNHFDFGKRTCAHDSRCKGYRETVRYGREIR